MMAQPEDQPQQLGRTPFMALLEERTRRYFGLSLEAFIRSFEAGELDDEPAALDIALLVGAGTR